ncbi:conserved Plasmodium protein, unknown function [Plasmodium berghei]|uniref:RAP domain-containing protein n=2 Tax=Plasmodium berghei TaxID=5821 RepID=A0A509AKN5_PLABA|nr:conserved Plasmodium protein, unknown function [Plasmodium berghei ANKA]CXI63893.1 conserved Plasmodium protein, unknown function [Plasmodium berghei]SCM23832.1 conserved Plasmodium protein, unknown function [Plasmodium berghei]SCN26796.1 conserved Plasmodium protein, unknown function [Plasmodium berghei]SCO61146.1 conserved Plasmodium protein, unknown function [Plasmodium berghei]SCO63215.1 conserved Plasmodium protein, unknown function [Plasmodium berghei]|eukprot:XP_034422413.1 conserved Plasmodium protein, unknown function [Plasmodium berghei ANKA]
MKNYILRNTNKCISRLSGGVEKAYINSLISDIRGKFLFSRAIYTNNGTCEDERGEKLCEDFIDDHRNLCTEIKTNVEQDEIYREKQNEFTKIFDENKFEKEDYSTVKIVNKNNTDTSEFLLNNENYLNFINKYNNNSNVNNNNSKTKGSRFSKNNLQIEDTEKSLWEILKEKEEYLKNKKKLKLYKKELDNKANKEYEKIIKEEKYINQKINDTHNFRTSDNKKKEEINNIEKKHKKKILEKNNIYNDIDTFLEGEQKYINDIKSYEEIYDENSKKINKKSVDEYKEEKKNDDNDFCLNNIISEDVKRHVRNYSINEHSNKNKQIGSNILINDLNVQNKNRHEILNDNLLNDQLFVEELNDISAKKCIEKIIIKKENKLIENSEQNLVEINAAEIIKKMGGENLSTIVDGNIDNLIIQKEIKKEKNITGLISVIYNNLDNCDNINLSSGIIKMSKMIDSYQKQSIMRNPMYLSIIKKVEENISTFELPSLVQTFYAFVKIDHLPYFFNDIINCINNKLDKAEPKHISSILYSLSNILIETNESRILKMKVIDVVKNNIKSFNCLNDAICLLTSLSKLKYKDIYVYYELSKKIEENIDELNMKNVSNILWSFSNINYTSKLIKNMKKIIEKNINNSNYIDIINIIYSLVKLNEYDEHLFNEIFPNFINVYIHNMNMKNLCMILWSYTYANIDNPDLYINILTKINEHIKEITTKDIISILTCLSRIKYNYRYKYLFTHLKNKIIKNLYSFTPLQLTNIIYYSSFLDLYDHKYYYLLIQQIYQIRKLLYLENLTIILYALKNVSYLNVHNIHVFNLISYIFDQIKKKYKLLTGEDCLNIMLIMSDLEKYTTQGYLTFFLHNNSTNNLDSIPSVKNQECDILLSNSFYNNSKTYENNLNKNYIDIFEEGVNLEALHFDTEEIYFPHISDLLYEQIKIRLNNFWQLNIKDVNNLLIIMKNVSTYDPVIINMIMRQIIPILLKCSNIEFLIFLSNITANTNLKFIALTHMSRRPKLLQVFKKKINSITSTILNNYEEADYSYQNEFNMTISNVLEENKRDLIKNGTVFSNIEKKHDDDIASFNVDTKTTINDISITNNISENPEKQITKNDNNIEINDMYNSLSKKKNYVDLNSCIALCYACFNIHYEDDNILKMYDVIEHMISEEKKPISSFMLINFLYILALTNNKLNTVIKLSQEYMNNRYGYNIEKKYNNSKYKTQTSFNLIYEESDGLSNYIEIGNEQTSLILLKLLYINIILNKYNYLYHILCEISKYNDNFYNYEFIKISKQVCYHIYNFSNFFSKNKSIEYTWNKVINNVYVNEEYIFLDLNYEKTNFNFIDIKKNHNIVNKLLNNPKIDQNIDNNIAIAKYFYYILNYNISDINNATPITSKKDKKKIKMFHFDNVISDILNFLNVQYKGSYTYENIYHISCSFPHERHMIDIIFYEDVLYPSHRPLLSVELRQKQLALKGWAVHSINFRDMYNSIKDKNIICYIFNIIKKIKKDLKDLPNNVEQKEEEEFWQNLKYANI